MNSHSINKKILAAAVTLFSGAVMASAKFDANVIFALVKCTIQQNHDGAQITECSVDDQSMKSEKVEISMDKCQTFQGQEVCVGYWSDSLSVSGSSFEVSVAVGKGASGPTFLDFKLKDQAAMVSLQLSQNRLVDAATLTGQNFADPANPGATLTPFIAISPSAKASIYSLRRAFQLK